MKQRKLELPDELKYENRLKWGYDSPDESPKQVPFSQHEEDQIKEIEVYNFFGYSFSEN